MEAEFEELIHSSRGLLSANEISELREFVQAGQHASLFPALPRGSRRVGQPMSTITFLISV